MMKKLLVFLMAFCLLVPGIAEAKTALEKAREKEYKTKMKEYKKGGYKILGSARTLDVALLTHYDKLNNLGDAAQEVSGVATKAKSKNVASQMAMNNACIKYASLAGRSLAGRVAADMAGNGVDPSTEFDNFYAAYESSVEKEIRGEMQPSFSVIRDNGDGTYEVESYFIISEEAATQARIRAMDNALKESAKAQEHAEKISEFVRDRVSE